MTPEIYEDPNCTPAQNAAAYLEENFDTGTHLFENITEYVAKHSKNVKETRAMLEDLLDDEGLDDKELDHLAEMLSE